MISADFWWKWTGYGIFISILGYAQWIQCNCPNIPIASIFRDIWNFAFNMLVRTYYITIKFRDPSSSATIHNFPCSTGYAKSMEEVVSTYSLIEPSNQSTQLFASILRSYVCLGLQSPGALRASYGLYHFCLKPCFKYWVKFQNLYRPIKETYS